VKFPNRTEQDLLAIIGQKSLPVGEIIKVYTKKRRMGPRTIYSSLCSLKRGGWLKADPHPEDDRAWLYRISDGGEKAMKLMRDIKEVLEG
jgi:DNA-binding PadR family transcriptional regulator